MIIIKILFRRVYILVCPTIIREKILFNWVNRSNCQSFRLGILVWIALVTSCKWRFLLIVLQRLNLRVGLVEISYARTLSENVRGLDILRCTILLLHALERVLWLWIYWHPFILWLCILIWQLLIWSSLYEIVINKGNKLFTLRGLGAEQLSSKFLIRYLNIRNIFYKKLIKL